MSSSVSLMELTTDNPQTDAMISPGDDVGFRWLDDMHLHATWVGTADGWDYTARWWEDEATGPYLRVTASGSHTTLEWRLTSERTSILRLAANGQEAALHSITQDDEVPA